MLTAEKCSSSHACFATGAGTGIIRGHSQSTASLGSGVAETFRHMI